MSNQEQVSPQTYVTAQLARNLSGATVSRFDPSEYKQTEDPPSSGVALLQGNATIGDVPDSDVSTYPNIEEFYEFPRPNGKRDYGLWLLRKPFIRRVSWSQLEVKPLATPRKRSLTLEHRYAFLKRAFDVTVSLILLTLLMPLLVVVVILVRLDSPGSALFRQRRVGRDGREFMLWKIRSMRADVAKYAPSPTGSNDPRLTRIGQIIRRVSIDELPQLVNVLKGDMSLVGPRPEMPFIVDRYTSYERTRLAVKPGMTGLWQISPARAFPIHENMQYDLHYISHQNLMLDAAILLRTITAVIHGIGAV